jgi:putative transposase
MSNFHRKRNRLPQASYLGRQIYFVTICSAQRRSVFTDSGLVALVLDVLRVKCSVHSFSVYAFCFMPNHIHLVLLGASDHSNLIALLRDFKGTSTARARAQGFVTLWQKGFYDHVLRSGEGQDAAAWYIFNNSVRSGLTKEMGEWPYSGSWMFDWKKLTAPIRGFVPAWKKAVAG